MADDVSGLKSLGSGSTKYQTNLAPEILETFPNKVTPPYLVEFVTREFTSLCPKTSQPDFAKIIIQYIPNSVCVESKSLKLYLGSFRNEGMFMETIVGRIFDDLFKLLTPICIRVVGVFSSRGGIETVVVRKGGDEVIGKSHIPNWSN